MTYFSTLLDQTKSKRVGLLGFDGVETLDLTGPLETFARARTDDRDQNGRPCYETTIVSVEKRTFASESGIVFKAQKTIQASSTFDTIIVPGGSGLRRRDTIRTVADWLKSRAHQTRRIVSVSTGIYAMASTGLLDERHVTTHWRFARDVAQRFPKLRVSNIASFLKDGAFYTCGGGTAGIEMTLALIEEDFGARIALNVARELVMRLRPPGDTESFIDFSRYQFGPSERLADLPAWMLAHLSENLSIEALAARTSLCPRHFSRLFKTTFASTPADFVEQLRLSEARQLLLLSRTNVTSVAAAVGFKSSDAFRRAFERNFGVTPSAFRNRREMRGNNVVGNGRSKRRA